MRVGVGGCVCEIRRVCMCVREVGWEGPWGE